MEERALQPEPIALATAVQAFVSDQTARKLLPQSINKSRYLLDAKFCPRCRNRGLTFLTKLAQPTSGHSDALGMTPKNRLTENMRSFFVFCFSNDWLQKNPMDGLKKPRVPDVPPTNYFTRSEFQPIVNPPIVTLTAVEMIAIIGRIDCASSFYL